MPKSMTMAPLRADLDRMPTLTQAPSKPPSGFSLEKAWSAVAGSAQHTGLVGGGGALYPTTTPTLTLVLSNTRSSPVVREARSEFGSRGE